MLCIAAAIEIESRGPVFDLKERVGKDVRPFVLISFWTGHQEPAYSREGMLQDDEVTRVGAFLHKTQLDRAPQLFNVLMGSMSIVGPTPQSERFYLDTQEEVPAVRAQLVVRPGISGTAQIGGAAAMDKEGAEAEYISANIEYVRKQSALLDMKILGLTLVMLYRGGNTE